MDVVTPAPQGVGIFVPQDADFAAVEQALTRQLGRLGGLNCCSTERLPAPLGSWLRVSLNSEAFQYLCRDFDTLLLRQRLARLAIPSQGDELHLEIWSSLLSAPTRIDFDSLEELQSHVRIRANIARAAEKTALAFKTEAAERPGEYWHDEEDVGFLLRPGACLIDALIAATQPERTGRLYDFSCYRATEYVILLGIAQEARSQCPGFYAQLENGSRQTCVKSGLFHEVFLTEYGSIQNPVPMHYYIPGDRVWFRNPDECSSNATGYEGSWVIYMGAGLFSNFWKRDCPYTLPGKCLEIYHWRDGAYQDEQGAIQMDEARVDAHLALTTHDPELVSGVMARMHQYRDASGVYAHGGCIDATREFPKQLGAIRLPKPLPLGIAA